MSQNLTSLISSLQTFLGDDGTRFSTPACTAAIRDALKTWNDHLPINEATIIDAVTDQLDYELHDEPGAEDALTITAILHYDEDGERHIPLAFTPFTENERLFFRLEEELGDGEYILARFTLPHTINGLDSETTSTLSAKQDTTLIKGAAAQACRIRGTGTVENNNLNKTAPAEYDKLADKYQKEFLAELAQLGEDNHMPQSEPDTHHWGDRYEGWT